MNKHSIRTPVLTISPSELYQSMMKYRLICVKNTTHVTMHQDRTNTQVWQQATAVNYAYLYNRIHSIADGSNEIQRSIIAKVLLAQR